MNPGMKQGMNPWTNQEWTKEPTLQRAKKQTTEIIMEQNKEQTKEPTNEKAKGWTMNDPR